MDFINQDPGLPCSGAPERDHFEDQNRTTRPRNQCWKVSKARLKRLLKVSKSRKQDSMFSFESKMNENIFVFLLPQFFTMSQTKKKQIQIIILDYKKPLIISTTNYIDLFFLLIDSFQRLRQNYKITHSFFGSNENFEICF